MSVTATTIITTITAAKRPCAKCGPGDVGCHEGRVHSYVISAIKSGKTLTWRRRQAVLSRPTCVVRSPSQLSRVPCCAEDQTAAHLTQPSRPVNQANPSSLATVVMWIVIGTVLLGLVILAFAVRLVLVRLFRLRRTVEPLLQREVHVAELQRKAEALQDRLLELRERVAAVQGRRP
jgi:hypothetical protein